MPSEAQSQTKVTAKEVVKYAGKEVPYAILFIVLVPWITLATKHGWQITVISPSCCHYQPAIVRQLPKAKDFPFL